VITARASKRRHGSPRTALDAQPIPQSSPQSETKTKRAKEARGFTLSDAETVVEWLNASKGTASCERVVFVRRELEALPAEWSPHTFGPPPWGRPVSPGVNNGDEWRKELRQLDLRHHLLNQALAKYIFRPRVTYRIADDTWHFGMVPDEKKRWIHIKVGERTISEADAVMSLVMLASIGEIERVHLCDMCKQRWHVAAKRNYRFCSNECRESFYKSAPEYHATKAAIQRRYRARQKEMSQWR